MFNAASIMGRDKATLCIGSFYADRSEKPDFRVATDLCQGTVALFISASAAPMTVVIVVMLLLGPDLLLAGLSDEVLPFEVRALDFVNVILPLAEFTKLHDLIPA